MIYRKNHYNRYNVVFESIANIQLTWRDIKKSDYMCMEQILTPEQQFRVLENDIVGACIIDHGNVHPLHLVGISDRSNFSTYQVNQNNYEECNSAQIQSVDISHSSFRRLATISLHVYANIGECNLSF